MLDDLAGLLSIASQRPLFHRFSESKGSREPAKICDALFVIVVVELFGKPLYRDINHRMYGSSKDLEDCGMLARGEDPDS